MSPAGFAGSSSTHVIRSPGALGPDTTVVVGVFNPKAQQWWLSDGLVCPVLRR
jgi:hypothetical protein